VLEAIEIGVQDVYHPLPLSRARWSADARSPCHRENKEFSIRNSSDNGADVQQSGTMRSLKGQMSLFDELRRQEPGLSDRQVLSVACRRLVREAHLEPPIDPVALAPMRGIVQVKTLSQPYHGYLFQLGDGRHGVHLRAQDHPVKRRFTLFHEIAHTLLPGFKGTREFRCAENSKQPKEQLSNHAAAELLFPRLFFEGDLHWAGLTTEGLEFLARRYQASLEATAIHAVGHWSGAAMLVVAKEHPQTAATLQTGNRPALVVSYSKRHGVWPTAASAYAVLRSGVLEQTLEDGRYEGKLSLNNHNQEQATRVRASAKAYPYRAGGQRQNRVIALLTPA
jgi:Zn-dependent peptidase ImmA (M78 family)